MFVIHSVSPPVSIYVAVRSVPVPATLAAFPAIVADTHVRFSLPVNETVIVSPIFAYPVFVFEEVIFTRFSIGLVQNEVKCKVSKLHSCAIPGNALPVHEKLLIIHELVSSVPSVSLTTILFSLHTPLGYCAVVRYIVNVAGRLLNALPDSVELL
jgi:hypothetical protein